MGSALAGPRELIGRARRFKALFGGGIRQGGIVAAGALWALTHHRARLDEDHARARRLAGALASMRGVVIDMATVATNIVRFQLRELSAAAFVDACYARGVYLLPSGRSGVRAVVHMDVGNGDIDRACLVIEDVLARGPAAADAVAHQ